MFWNHTDIPCKGRAEEAHCTFRKAGCNPITIPVHEPIKVTYVRMVKEIIESEEE